MTLLSFSTVFAQTDSTDFEFEMTMSADDYEYVKTIIKEDVVNWCNKRNEKLNTIVWKMMVVRDTVIPVTIATDTGNFEIDIVNEFQRRAIGGFSGSYPFVQSWSFNVTEEQLIEIIKEIKTENPDLQVPGDTSLTSGRHSYWFFIDFYNKDKQEVVSTWTRESTKSSTTLALVSYHQHTGNEYGFGLERKLINRDFWKVENDNRIKRFETMIVDKIREKIK